MAMPVSSVRRSGLPYPELDQTDTLHLPSRYKAWRVVGVHPICGVLFVVGYAVRGWAANGTNYLYSNDNPASLGTFVVSQVFIYCAP